MFTSSRASFGLPLLPWAPVWTAAEQTWLCTSDSAWPGGRSLWKRPAGASGTTPTAAWPWCSGSGAARTQILPEPVCRCPTVSRRTASTCSLLWGTPRSPAPGNTSPEPGGQSGRQETAIWSWLDCHKGQGTGFFWAQWFAVFFDYQQCQRVVRGYHEEELQVQACDRPQRDDKKVKAGLGSLRDWKLKQEGEDSQEICVDVVERELHKHRTGPVNAHTHTNTHSMDLWRYFTSCFGSNFNISSYWSWVFPSQEISFHTRDKKHQLSSVQRQWNVLSETPPPTFYWLSAALLWKFET